ncbi:unnamed protein product [Rotaria socialis]|uniref:Uncharacterized protein n=1 Tax=Rotaria socialis TaxID=392032 RepID=A0A818BIS2_9BILA|nr:unnamed protein product [Rotaria socialis]CAF4178355.1 unnamed protein product [Rotaria socialis]
MFLSIFLILLIPDSIISVPYDTVSGAQLITSNIVSLWLYNQSSWSYCMCQALQYEQATIVAFNYFINYQACELIPNGSPSNGTYYMTSSSSSAIYILNKDTFNSVNVTQPVGLALNADLNVFAITYGIERSIQLREASKSMTAKQNTLAGANAQPISYHDGIYFAGINPPTRANPFNFYDQPYGLAKSNDDAIIYVSGNNATIYQLSTSTFMWSILVPNYNSTEIPMSLAVDSCGNRLWVLMLGFGIRIYDRIYGNEVASWNMSMPYPTLYDMILTSDYELYLIDSSMNQLIHYGLPLNDQCTIN